MTDPSSRGIGARDQQVRSHATSLGASPGAAVRRRRGTRTAVGAAVVGAGAAVVLVNPTIGAMSLVPACPFRSLTGLDCPLCGGTRAARSLLAGDVPAALDYNLLVTLAAFLGLVAAGWFLAAQVLPRVTAAPLAAAVASRTTVVVAVALFAVFWVARNLPFVPYLSTTT